MQQSASHGKCHIIGSEYSQRVDRAPVYEVGDPKESSRFAELILKAAHIWHQQQNGKNAKPDTKSVPDLPKKLSPKQERILAALEEVGPTLPRFLSKYSRIPLPTLQRELKTLLKRGLVTKEGQTRGVRYALLKHKKCHD